MSKRNSYKRIISTKDMKVAIIGSSVYENKRKIQEMIFQFKQNFGDRLTIMSSGNKDGTDKYVKKYCLDMGIDYVEYNPAHTVHNLYSALREDYYNKPYHVTQIYHRYDLLAKDCDAAVVFIPEELETKDINMLHYFIKKAKKVDKNTIIIS